MRRGRSGSDSGLVGRAGGGSTRRRRAGARVGVAWFDEDGSGGGGSARQSDGSRVSVARQRGSAPTRRSDRGGSAKRSWRRWLDEVRRAPEVASRR